MPQTVSHLVAPSAAPAITPAGRIGSWDLHGLLGSGQLADVYQACPAGTPLRQAGCYAVKLLRATWQDHPAALSFLQREVQVARAVSHPNLIPVLASNLREAPYFVVMPYLAGNTLESILADEGPLFLPRAFWIARQIAAALAALRQEGWTHGDVKPSNVLISPTGHATLFDLGFARFRTERGHAVADRPVLGTIHYLAPEALYSSLGSDIHADVYSLGVILFRMLAGRLPFDADDIAELASQHRQELPQDLRSIVPELPTRAARLLRQMLAKEPLRRPLPDEVVDRLVSLEIETFAERFGGGEELA